jgi:hypothetical protein
MAIFYPLYVIVNKLVHYSCFVPEYAPEMKPEMKNTKNPELEACIREKDALLILKNKTKT